MGFDVDEFDDDRVVIRVRRNVFDFESSSVMICGCVLCCVFVFDCFVFSVVLCNYGIIFVW